MGKKNYYFLLMFVMMNIMAVATSTVKAEAWDGTKVELTFTEEGEGGSHTLEFTATETKEYTFKCDTKEYGARIKATVGGQSYWGDALHSYYGATITVAATAGQVITLTLICDEYEGFPLILPLELADGGGGDIEVPGEAWDGSTLNLELATKDDSKTFSYTADQNEIFYLFSKATAFDVKFAGGVVGQPDLILEWEAYDNLVGGYSAIRLMEGDVLNFTVTSTEFLEGQGADFPRKFSISSLAVPVRGFTLPGANFDGAINLVPGVESIVPVNSNPDEFPDFSGYSELSWLKFEATATGIADVDIEQNVIFVWEEDNVGSLDVKPLSVVQDETTNSHEFAVKAGITYYVLTTNNRPEKVSLKLTAVEEGSDCIVPVNITSATQTLSVKAGATWFNYTIEKSENSDLGILELASNNGWTGAISYYLDCADGAPTVLEVAAGGKSYFELDADRANYLICVNSATAVTDAIKLTQRDAKPGEAKVNPLDAALGSNNKYGGEKRDYWFKYVASKDCMLTITYPEGALKLIVLGTGTTDVAVPGSTTCVSRANAGDEYRMKFNASDAEEHTFTIAEESIPEGDYCDYPRTFTLGDNITMVNRNYQEEWYKFTASEDGIVEFEVEDPIWVRDRWSTSIVKECGGQYEKLTPEELRGTLTYRYSVLKGKTYRFTVTQFYTKEDGKKQGDDIIIKTKFTPASAGESCAKAIKINYNTVTTCKDVISETWYEFEAPEDGIYYAVASLGQGGGLSYKKGDCSADTKNAITANYMYGRSYVELAETEGVGVNEKVVGDLKAGQIVKLCAKITKDKPDDQSYDYSLIVRKKADGDDLSAPLTTQAGVYYPLGAGNVNTAAMVDGYPYSITASAEGKIVFTVLTEDAYFKYGSLPVYSGTTGIASTAAKEKADNGDGTYTYVCTLSGDAIEANKAYTVLVPFTMLGFNLGSSLITGIESTESFDRIIVSPNPSDGNFQIDLGELSAEGALIEVINMAGVTVYKESTTSTIVPVSLKGIAAGIYFVRVNAGNKSIVAKLVIR